MCVLLGAPIDSRPFPNHFKTHLRLDAYYKKPKNLGDHFKPKINRNRINLPLNWGRIPRKNKFEMCLNRPKILSLHVHKEKLLAELVFIF